MAKGHDVGCHVCGGFPGSKTKNVAKLLECGSCGFFTCNKHIASGISKECPNCKEKKRLKVVSDAASVKRKKSGSKVATTGGGGGGGGAAASAVDEDTNSASSASFTGSNVAAPATGGKPEEEEDDDIVANMEEEDILPSAEDRVKGAMAESMEDEDTLNIRARTQLGVVEQENGLNTVSGNDDINDGFADDTSEDDLLSLDDAGIIATSLEKEEEQISDDEESKTEEYEDFSDEIDFEALEMMGELIKEQEEGTSLHRSIKTDAFFKVLSAKGLENCQEYLESEKEAISVVSVDVSQKDVYKQFLSLINKNKQVFGVTGFGPQSLRSEVKPSKEALDGILTKNPKIIAVGDIGLDLHFAPYTIKEQKQLFRDQVELAMEKDIPVFFNSVKADQEVAELIHTIREEGEGNFKGVCVPVVRSVDLFSLCLEENMNLLVRPEVTYPEEELYRECIKEMGLKKILLASGNETSAPLSRLGQWNSPEYISETLKALAKIFREDEADVRNQMTSNFNNLFNHDPDAQDDMFDFILTPTNPALVLATSQLLENDTDSDGDELEVVRVDKETAHGGMLIFTKDEGRIVYTPPPYFEGTDTFLYTVSDGRGGVDNGKVSINVIVQKEE